MMPTVLWQGEGIRCMKAAHTLQCKICMVERKEILSRFRSDKSKIINDNSDIYSSYKCGSKSHKFARTITTTLKTRLTQKESPSNSSSKTKRSRRIATPRTPKPKALTKRATPSPEQETPWSSATPAQLIDTNVPGLPYRSPNVNPTNLELAQYEQ